MVAWAVIRIKPSSLVYIDTNVFIYFVEGEAALFHKANALFAHIDQVGARLATSEITIAECLYKPSQTNNKRAISTYEELLEHNREIEKISLTGELAKRASLNGSRIGLKLVDAIHYTSALDAGCDFFATADNQFRSGPAMTVISVK